MLYLLFPPNYSQLEWKLEGMSRIGVLIWHRCWQNRYLKLLTKGRQV